MSASITSGSYPRPLHTPGGALQRTARAVWDLIGDVGARRARQHLFALARQQQTINPELALRLRDAARRSMMD